MTKDIEQLKEKIELFKQNLKDYKNKNYDEYNTRADFIDSLFSALGWDMYNEQGIIEQFREVVREDKVKIDGKRKAPDYAFRIGQQVIFYVEAKKPSIDIKNDPEPAYQLRRYAYTQGLKLSILTDFEEIAVYDTRVKPNKKDSAGVARIFYCTFDELFSTSKMKGYETNFDFLYNTFSKEAILNGSFNRYAEENKNKKGTESVDKGFLALLNKWRKNLAKNIALRNNNIDIYNLNLVVQKMIDRFIFLRIAEDRFIEKENLLLEIASKNEIYRELLRIFDEADKKYNSSLFVSEEWMKDIIIEDKVLKEIIKEMYYPECPYEFSVLPIEILGRAYEQFLGKTIVYKRKTKSGYSIEIEDKPEVRKAGGVYYTPEYIVNYIVDKTVGEKIKGKTPAEITELSVLDPACGSGSFLLGAYDYLLKYHLKYYLKNEARKKKALKEGIIFEIGKDRYSLSTKTKSEILTNNIYGVDIDKQATEVTKLSLLLKVLEDENIEYGKKLFNTQTNHLLPDLSKNIKCGNSLIASDFYNGKNMDMFDINKMRKINTMGWDKAFPQIFKKGGFDIVIGNPPYGADLSDAERKYLENKYGLRNTDTACLFMGLAIDLLNKKGVNGYIVPKPFVYSSNWRIIREKLLNGLIELVDCGKVWKKVKLEQVIYIWNNEGKNKYISSYREKEKIINVGQIDKSTFNLFGFYLNGISKKELNIGLKLRNTGIFLNDFCINQRGAMYQKYITNEKSDYKVIGGKQIGRFFLESTSKGYIRKINLKENKGFIFSNAILVQNIVAHIQNPVPHIKIISTMTNENMKKYIILDTVNQLQNISNYSSEYLLGMLNSKLISWYVYRFVVGKAIRTMHFDNVLTSKIPYPNLDLNNDKDKKIHDKMVSLVDQMLETQKLLHSATAEENKRIYEQKVQIIDDQINNLVYELYELTPDEIAIVEEG